MLQADGAVLCPRRLCVLARAMPSTLLQPREVCGYCHRHPGFVWNHLLPLAPGINIRQLYLSFAFSQSRILSAPPSVFPILSRPLKNLLPAYNSTRPNHPPHLSLCSRPLRRQSGQRLVRSQHRPQTPCLPAWHDPTRLSFRNNRLHPPRLYDHILIPPPRTLPLRSSQLRLGVFFVFVPSARKKCAPPSTPNDNLTRWRRRARRTNARVGWLGEHPGRMDLIPSAQTRWLAASLLHTHFTLVVPPRPPPNLSIALLDQPCSTQ